MQITDKGKLYASLHGLTDQESLDAAFLEALNEGDTATAKLLLEAGADDDLILELASRCGHTEFVKLLLEARADAHAYNNLALRWASDNGHTEVVELLKKYGKNRG
jgi:ankyrin repeat protein